MTGVIELAVPDEQRNVDVTVQDADRVGFPFLSRREMDDAPSSKRCLRLLRRHGRSVLLPAVAHHRTVQ